MDKVSLTIASHLSCMLCSQPLYHAVSLPCGHSICRLCLEAAKKTAAGENIHPEVTCPTCQEPTEHWHFPTNPLLGHIICHLKERRKAAEQMKKCWEGNRRAGDKVPCGLCKPKNKACKFCRTCEFNYCKKCLKNYHQGPDFEAHILSTPLPETLRSCTNHWEESLTHFCFSDHTGVCGSCVQQDHEDHHVATLDDACLSRKRSLHATLQHAKHVLAECMNEVRAVKDRSSDVSKRGEEFKQRLRDGFTALHTSLLDQEELLLTQFDNVVRNAQTEGSYFIKLAEVHLNSLDSFLMILEEALQEPDEIVFLQGIDSLMQLLAKAVDNLPKSGHNLQDDPLRNVELDFQGLLGKVQGLLKEHLNCGMTADSRSSVEVDHVETEAQEDKRESEEEIEAAEEDNEELFSLPAGDTGREPQDLSLLPRAPIIYQHNVKGFKVEIFWMMPMGEDVESFDVQLREVLNAEASDGEQVLVENLKTCCFETEILTQNSQYSFRVRSVNKYGPGRWSEPYWVNTKNLDSEITVADPILDM
ncbi:tripartite motif-containing protein 42-like [Chanos chanos]|uniref:Tripartite motif-containing protein 42-like n=1 Tax=Chanos chanos TaxID=29144 RepID=A0A6J2VE32_CHACN|nr:tripartite motif-containing protein 42 [Chanos chanos]